MPRIGRVVAPNMPHHVVQRGHNRNAVFVDDGNYSYSNKSVPVFAVFPVILTKIRIILYRGVYNSILIHYICNRSVLN